MNPQIAAVINSAHPYISPPNEIARSNAEKVLNYIEDINLEKNICLGLHYRAAFFAWSIGDWEYDMECVKNGYIIYSFTKCGYEKASGCARFDEFIPQFEKYLLML